MKIELLLVHKDGTVFEMPGGVYAMQKTPEGMQFIDVTSDSDARMFIAIPEGFKAIETVKEKKKVQPAEQPAVQS